GAGGAAASSASLANQQASASIYLQPIPRFNSILVAAPQARFDDVITQIKRLDQPNSPEAKAVPFPLAKAPASQVATLLTSFFATRYAVEPNALDQVRITVDPRTNTILVQAGPADMAEIRDMIKFLDNSVSHAVNELRIVPLRTAL